MKFRNVLIVALLCASAHQLRAQNVGLSFSYFLPKHGDFSTPISPFSLRGVGVDINRFLALETGATLYRMTGMGMTGLPFQYDHSMVGPNFTAFVPAELVLQLKGKSAQLDLKAGGFGFYGFNQHLITGNWDRAVRSWKGWDVANGDLSFSNHPGYGWQAGIELTVEISRQFGLSFEVNYLAGQAKLPVRGSYTGGVVGGTLMTIPADFNTGKIDFTGLEFSIGVMTLGGGRR